MKAFSTILLVLVAVSLTAQVEVSNGGWSVATGRVKGNGELVTQSRDLEGFTGISTCCSFEIKLAEGPYEVRIEAESNLLAFIKTEVQHQVLQVGFTKRANFKSQKPIKVYVSLPNLKTVVASSSSKVTGTTSFTGTDLRLDVSSAATIDLAFNGDHIDLKASTTGRIDVAGSAGSVSAAASSGSRIQAADLRANEVDADVRTTAKMFLFVEQQLRADASSSGSIVYSGSPGNVQVNTGSNGRVRPAK